MQKQQGGVALNREHGDRYSELVGLFQRQVNAAYVDPDYIAKVLKLLDRHPDLLSEVRTA